MTGYFMLCAAALLPEEGEEQSILVLHSILAGESVWKRTQIRAARSRMDGTQRFCIKCNPKFVSYVGGVHRRG